MNFIHRDESLHLGHSRGVYGQNATGQNATLAKWTKCHPNATWGGQNATQMPPISSHRVKLFLKYTLKTVARESTIE